MSGLEARLRAVEDELAIRALAARFSDCANERDLEGFADLWSARGVWEIGEPLAARAEGVDAIVAMLRRLLDARTGFVQLTHSGVVRLAGDRATARSVEGEHAATEGDAERNLAVCSDVLAREADGRWRFLRRSCEYRRVGGGAPAGATLPTASARPAAASGARA